ncbi:CAAX amino terminal protease self- immunity [Corynebacterium glaucum]|uniref:CAAX amino terminal protease self-immunity n=1 Tax=Corynebacterium glaucum TaxID=187491 RepID=A0A1Q2HYD8_9CORY|nr:type II CAAX endopeptidase family protein [Corynebacterium glaucum]AQQ15861.1 CAAX amino terminal protease self- immunity [Corynebacterium glaucum]
MDDAPKVIAPYHRLNRTRPDWWRPLVELGLAAVFGLLFQIAWIIAMMFGPVTLESLTAMLFERDEWSADPATSLMLFGGIATGIPAVLLAARISGRPRGTLWSVERRFRWRRFGQALLFITLPAAVLQALDVALYGMPAPVDRTFWLHVAVACTALPLQCVAEELIFRGMLPQAMGTWMRSAWLAYLVALPIFVIGHPYGASGLISVAIFGALASLLTHRTGGLEAAIALHITLNATVYFGEFSGIAQDFGIRQLLAALTVLAMYGGAGLLLLLGVNTTVAPPQLDSVRVRSLPHPSGELLGARGIDVVGPGGVVLCEMPWRGDSSNAELAVPGWRFRYTALHGRFNLRCTNTGPTPQPVYLAIVPHFARGQLQGLVLHDAHRTVKLTPTGATGMVVWHPPEGGICAGPELRDTLLLPGKSVQIELTIEVV